MCIRDSFIADPAFHIGKGMGIRRVHDLRFRLHHIQETAESGKAFLHHLDQFYKDLDGTDKNADVKRVHGKISHFHLTFRDQIPSEDKGDQVHHALKEQIPSHKTAHTVVVIPFRQQERMVAFAEFFPLNLLIGKGLYDADTGQSVLQTGVYISDLPAVLHECFLHPLVLPEREEEHAKYQDDQRKRQHPVDNEQKEKRADDFHQGDEKIFRTVVRELRDVEEIGDQLAHHLSGIIFAVVGEGQLLIMIKQLLAHVPLHIGAHHVSLETDIIFAQTLNHIHKEKG